MEAQKMDKKETNTPETPAAPEQQQKTEAPAAPEQQKSGDDLQAKYDALVAAQEANNATLESVFNDLALKIPEKYHSLIPKGLHLTDRIKWVNDAYSLGLFDAPKQKDSPDAKRPMPQPENLDKLSSHALMSRGYQQ